MSATAKALAFSPLFFHSLTTPSFLARFAEFFPDASQAIGGAARLLSRKASSRLVLSHLNGAAFVRQERVDNPQTVLSTMPTLAELASIAEPLGFEVVLPAFFGEEPEQIQRGLDDFYLVVLRWSETALIDAEEA